MLNIKDKKLNILLSILFALIIILGLSFIPSMKNDKKMGEKSVLVNSKYDIKKINLYSKNGNDLTFYNLDGFWGGEFYNGVDFIYFPVDDEKIEELISKAKEITLLRKVADIKNPDVLKKYNSGDNYVCASFYDSTGDCVSSINFGVMNQTMDQIFIWTGKKDTVYSMDSRIAYYLETDLKFWQEQDVIPKYISRHLDYASIQDFTYQINEEKIAKASEEAKEKFPSLRYSEIVTDFKTGDKTLEIKISDGKGTYYKYSFYTAETLNGECYIYNLEISPSIIYSDIQKEFIKKLNYSASVSKWTYDSIIKLLEGK